MKKPITRAQRLALSRIWHRTIMGEPNPLTYKEFRRTAIDCGEYLMVPWAGMMLGIEKDGYTHS